MVDVEVIRRILTSLNESLAHLEAKKNISFETYERDKDLQAIVERRLETAIQACIDTGNHIIAQQNLGSPSDYGEIFSILAQNGIIDGEQEKLLVKMAGFRNILVHEYKVVLNEKVYDVLQNGLPDLYNFAKAILDYIEKP